MSQEKTEIDKREEFDLFLKAGLIGLLFGIGGGAFVEYLILNNEDNTESILILITIATVFIAWVIFKDTKKSMGVNNSIGDIFFHEKEDKDLHTLIQNFIELYKKSNVNSDSKLNYAFNDKENEKFMDNDRNKAELVISNKNEKLNFFISFSDYTIKTSRPTLSKNREAEKFNKLFVNFLEKLPSDNNSLITKIKHEGEYIPED